MEIFIHKNCKLTLKKIFEKQISKPFFYLSKTKTKQKSQNIYQTQQFVNLMRTIVNKANILLISSIVSTDLNKKCLGLVQFQTWKPR